MVSWLLAAALSMDPSEVVREPYEKLEFILWVTAAVISLIPVVIFTISYPGENFKAIDNGSGILYLLYQNAGSGSY